MEETEATHGYFHAQHARHALHHRRLRLVDPPHRGDGAVLRALAHHELHRDSHLPAGALEYDSSCVVALVAGLAFGPVTGTIVVVLSWLVHLVFQFSPWGVLMAIAANVSLVVPCSLIARKLGGKRGLATGMAAGAVISLAVCIVMNLIVTPLYTAVTVDAVVAMILPILVPFNVLKLALNCALTALVQGPVSKALAG